MSMSVAARVDPALADRHGSEAHGQLKDLGFVNVAKE
jgi:hypothetical protein